MAYVPRGVVHDAIATDEVSLHVTTGLLTPRWVDLVVEAVAELAQVDPAFRRAVPPGFANDGFDRTEARAMLRSLLERAAEGADADRTLDGFVDDFRRARVPVVPGQFLQHVAADGIEPGTRMVRRPDLIYGLFERAGEGGDEIVLSVYGNDIAFPVHAADALRDALARPGFTVGDLAGDLDEGGQAVLARRLVREGVLAVAN